MTSQLNMQNKSVKKKFLQFLQFFFFFSTEAEVVVSEVKVHLPNAGHNPKARESGIRCSGMMAMKSGRLLTSPGEVQIRSGPRRMLPFITGGREVLLTKKLRYDPELIAQHTTLHHKLHNAAKRLTETGLGFNNFCKLGQRGGGVSKYPNLIINIIMNYMLYLLTILVKYFFKRTEENF